MSMCQLNHAPLAWRSPTEFESIAFALFLFLALKGPSPEKLTGHIQTSEAFKTCALTSKVTPWWALQHCIRPPKATILVYDFRFAYFQTLLSNKTRRVGNLGPFQSL